MPDTNLLPCPFCGEDAYLVTWHQGTQIAARCGGCTCDGPMRGIESQAIAAWNTRALTPKQKAADEMFEALRDAEIMVGFLLEYAKVHPDFESTGNANIALADIRFALAKAGQQ